MGLSNLPAPSEGILCVLLINTVRLVSMVKSIVISVLHIVGIHLISSTSDPSENHPHELNELQRFPSSNNFIDEFRIHRPSVRFDAISGCKMLQHDCLVCLSWYEPESEINKLDCGHVFHKVCLERWMEYWNITCPLCRNPLLPENQICSS